jgi:hypothetical protein
MPLETEPKDGHPAVVGRREGGKNAQRPPVIAFSHLPLPEHFQHHFSPILLFPSTNKYLALLRRGFISIKTGRESAAIHFDIGTYIRQKHFSNL